MEPNYLSTYDQMIGTVQPVARPEDLEEWTGQTFRDGDWHVDRVQVDGLDGLVHRLDSVGSATFTVVQTEEYRYTVRESAPVAGPVRDQAAYPERRDGARGPLTGWTRDGETQAIRAYIASRSVLGRASTWEVWRDGSQTRMRLTDAPVPVQA